MALTAKQRRFVAEYLKDLNATQAAIRCGYSQKTAMQQGSRLLSIAKIAQAVASGKQQQLAKAELTATRVLEELRRVAFLDPGKFYDPKGRLLPVHELDEEVRACLAGLEVARANLNVTDGKRDDEWLHKIRYYDKLKALEILAKHFALLKDVVEVTGDWDKLAARLASVRNEPDARR